MSVLRNLINFCRFSRTESDNQQFPAQQIEYLGKVADAFVILPYGMHANIPPEFLGILMKMSGQEQNRVVLPLSPKQRPKNLAPGDLVFYSPITGEKIVFAAAGGVTISAPNGITIVGDTTFQNNVTINGNLTVTGSTILGAVTSNGKDISDAHTHSGVTPGVGTSGPVT